MLRVQKGEEAVEQEVVRYRLALVVCPDASALDGVTVINVLFRLVCALLVSLGLVASNLCELGFKVVRLDLFLSVCN